MSSAQFPHELPLAKRHHERPAALHTLALTFAAVSVSSAGSRLQTACAAPLVTRNVVPPAAWIVASVRCA